MSRSLFALLNLSMVFGAAWLGMWFYQRSKPDFSDVSGSRLLGSKVRGWYFTNLDPFEELFVRFGVTPAAITMAQLVGSVLCAVTYGYGLIYTGGFMMLASGTLDILDGRLARRLGSASKRGAFLDSVVDRYSEFAVIAGLMVYFGGGWPVWALLFFLLGGMMVSYTRARAEGLGQDCRVGMLQRPERVVILGFGSIFSAVVTHAIGGDQTLLKLVVLLLAVFTNLTALQRFFHVSRGLARNESRASDA